MLAVNADDLGRNVSATDRIAECFLSGGITAASFMVFMADSKRAASIAADGKFDVGLHLNFTERFTGEGTPASVRKAQDRVARFLKLHKCALLLYHPLLRGSFREVIAAQVAEFRRLFGRLPDRVDGHQHMHLCTNVLVDKLLPSGIKVRRSFSFSAGEKSEFNRAYRRWVDGRLAARNTIGDYFFAFSQNSDGVRLERILKLGKEHEVELMTHPEIPAEHEFLMSDSWRAKVARKN
jgi:chitin disaccharide deacetylase